MIVDVFCIAVGFVLRVFGGGLAIDVPPSAWLVLATFLLSLFLALAKRRHELRVLEEGANKHRPVLEQYSVALVDELISVVTPVTLITYILYTLDAGTMNRSIQDCCISQARSSYSVYSVICISFTERISVDRPLALY